MKLLHDIDWWKVITAIISFVIGLIVKTLLDYDLAKFIVKYFSWIPVRFIFRQKPPKISGDWEQQWDFAGTVNYLNETERHSYTNIQQIGNYCYCEFYSRNEKYYFFGKITDNYINGKWGDCKDELGYYGSFQLRIVNSKYMEGKWIGHSKTTQNILGDKWTWNKKG